MDTRKRHGYIALACALVGTAAFTPHTAYALDDFIYDTVGEHFGIVGIIIVGIILAVIRIAIRNKLQESRDARAAQASYRQASGASWGGASASQSKSYTSPGSASSAGEFEKRMGDLYTRMQQGWDKGEIRRFKYNFTPEAWEAYSSRMQAEEDSGQRTHIQNVWVRRVDMHAQHQPDGAPMREVHIISDEQRYVTGPDGAPMGDTDVCVRVETVWTMVQPDKSKDEWLIRSIEEPAAQLESPDPQPASPVRQSGPVDFTEYKL